MEREPVIKIEGLYKKFCRSIKRSLAYGTIDTFRAFVGISHNRGRLRKSEFWSLEDINLEIYKGETFGLIGANGSGKSTLLRLINGIFPPDKGRISISGRIGALIAVGAGFHPHMTGRENIYLNGVVLGMTRQEIDHKMQDIIDFAEIGEFLDAPVSTYSSGMYVRLGFAIAIHSNPDIVLVDEILAVGDAKFQRKCLDKIREMRERGVTFILVSHNMQNIEAMCSRALLMDHGKQIMVGTPKEIIPVYELLLQTGRAPEEFLDQKAGTAPAAPSQGDGELNLVFKYSDFGTDELKVNKVKLFGQDGQPKLLFSSDEPLTVELDVDSQKAIQGTNVWLSFRYVNSKEHDDENFETMGARMIIDIPQGKSKIKVDFKEVQMTTGEYKMGLYFFDHTFSQPYAQGSYGYLAVKGDIPTMLRVRQGTPLIWVRPHVELKNLD